MNIDLHTAQIFDVLVERWRKIVVPFFTADPKSKTRAKGFGSGFMAVYKGVHFLVTAKHVLDDARRYGICAININDHALLLQNIYFFTDPQNDLAFAPIEETLINNKIKSILAIDLTKKSAALERLGYHLLMGYPASRNKLDPRWGKVDRMLLSITAEENAAKNILVKTISDPVIFDYDPKKQLDSSFKPTGQPPDLYGMSGGPALEVRFSRNEKEEYSFHVTLSGVLVEWHDNKRAIVAASNASLIKAFEAAASTYLEDSVAGQSVGKTPGNPIKESLC